jgi:hypothetical protein
MNIPLLEKRVRSLEEMMADLIATTTQTSIEMRDFKEEMRLLNERLDRDIEESKQDRLDRKLEQRRFNQELGGIARKQGRMAEDLVAPSICRILRQIFKIPMIYECGEVVRYRRIHPEDGGRMKEFDVIAVCGDYVMVNETKSKLEPSNVPELLETIREFREYFPDYKDKKIVGSLATLFADESLIKYASREGILILAVGEELMDVMNEPGFKPAEF